MRPDAHRDMGIGERNDKGVYRRIRVRTWGQRPRVQRQLQRPDLRRAADQGAWVPHPVHRDLDARQDRRQVRAGPHRPEHRRDAQRTGSGNREAAAQVGSAGPGPALGPTKSFHCSEGMQEADGLAGVTTCAIGSRLLHRRITCLQKAFFYLAKFGW